jgi:hypothetical protein
MLPFEMVMRFLPLCGVLVAAEAFAQANSGAASTLASRVLDKTTGAPVAGAEVDMSPDGGHLLTDSTGGFRAVGLATGVYTVRIRRVGYQQFSDLVSVGPEAETRHDFRLTRLVTLDTVQTRAKGVTYISPALRGFEERRAAGHGYFIAEAELRKADNRTLANVLMRLPGIMTRSHRSADYVASRRSAGGGPAGGLSSGGGQPRADPNDPRSPRGCWVAVYLDGVAVYLGPPAPAPDLGRTLVRELAGVEFYAGSATLPAQFSAIKTSDCGVLLLWTREH